MHYLIYLCINLCMHIIRRTIGSDRIFNQGFRSDPTERNYRLKLLPSARNQRTSDGLPLRRGHPSLVKWIRIKSHVSSELLKMPTLIRRTQMKNINKSTISFENKTWFLINQFFSTSFSTDLNDIFNVTYLTSMHCLTIIIEKKMIKIMKNLNSNKIFKSNNIINHFLKICEKKLINILILFF